MNFSSWIAFAGGIALFLLGMQLMTEGLKNAAGDGLRAVLAQATRSRARAIGAGMMVTASVQSSSAVIFALVGFVNAGLMTLAQAFGVILGANIGTTATSWLVALAGFRLDLQALALPLLIVGMGLRVLRGRYPSGAFGLALVGLGLFFLGLDLLKGGFDDLAGAIDFSVLASWPVVFQVFAMVVLGIALTVLMQSSSAALAVVLTGAAAGWIDLPAAMAMVIGANVGTTSTAAFAVIGATAPAKRAAAAHVLFALIVAVAALATFPAAQIALSWIEARAGGLHIAVLLAMFHTYTKVLGLVIVLPMADRLATWLEGRFQSAEPVSVVAADALGRESGDGASSASAQLGPSSVAGDTSRTLGGGAHASESRVMKTVRMAFLDEHVLRTPALAIEASKRELARMQADVLVLVQQSLQGSIDEERLLAGRRQASGEVIEFSEWVAAISSDDERDETLEQRMALLYAGQYLQDVLERLDGLRRGAFGVEARPANDPMSAMLRWRDAVLATMTAWSAGAALEAGTVQEERERLENEYQRLKQSLILAASARAVPAARMVEWLDAISDLRRVLDQWAKLTLRRLALGAFPEVSA
ncbi:MAG: Na/Pi cotransporter family protein [Thioalkalivibrionaceae bacterium]